MSIFISPNNLILILTLYKIGNKKCRNFYLLCYVCYRKSQTIVGSNLLIFYHVRLLFKFVTYYVGMLNNNKKEKILL